jgi:predicted alpha-1,6-mannanase (GH76 family)
MTDAYLRSGNEKYKDYADRALAATISRNNSRIINDYHDDMQWMALALLRLYDHTREHKYMIYIEDLWSDIIKGWNDHMGGGIAWRKQQLDYKNTPSNAPAAILSARLYNTLGEEIYLDWAIKLFRFVDENLADKQTGQIWDGMNRQGGGEIDKNWVFTYCHGIYIGAAVELYKITGEQVYFDKAMLTAEFALERFIHGNGVFAD